MGKAQWGSIEIGAGGGIFEALQNAGLIIVSLGVVQEAANSSVPALGYAGTYAFSSFLLTLAGTAMVMI